jgi:hypothetical protein
MNFSKNRSKKMNPILSLIAFLLLPALLFAQDIGWYNGKTSPYSISNEDELKGLQYLVNNVVDNFSGKTIKLAGNISLTAQWTPIGDYSSNTRLFQGTFDGQGYTISGLTVVSKPYGGFFGYVGGNGQIKNLNIVATTISGSKETGGLAAHYASTMPIENCSVQADAINNTASADGSVISYSGGLVGYASAALTITNSYASGNVSARAFHGVVGTAETYGGGLVGYASAALTITNSYASGKVSSIADLDETCGTGKGYGGGLVGYASAALTITNSYASGNVFGAGLGRRYTADGYGGGLVGYANGTSTITNSYSSGNISASGTHTSTTVNGGIFGRYLRGTNTSVYFNSAGSTTAQPSGILPMSPDNLKKQNTFVNWDFNNVWGIVENTTYPYLKNIPTKVTVPLSATVEIEYLIEQPYTGTQIKPEPTVKLKSNGTILTKGTDYALTYGANKNAGKGTVTIVGIDTDYLGLEKTIEFDIIPKTITITNAVAQNKVYNGTTAAAITGTLEGIVTGDNVTIGSGVFASKDAGTGIAVSNVSIGGNSAANYKLAQPADLTANITKKPLTITLNPKTVTIAKSDPMTKVTEKLVYDGLISGETSSVITGTTAVFKDGLPLNTTPAAGEYIITLNGTRTATNYEISYDNEGLKLIVTGDPPTISSSSSTVTTQSSSSETTTPSSSSSSTETVPSSSSVVVTLSSSSEVITPSSSSVIAAPSSSSVVVTLSSSSETTTPSSSSSNTTSSNSNKPSSSSAAQTNCAYQASWCNNKPVTTTPTAEGSSCFFVSDITKMLGSGIKVNGVTPTPNNGGSEFVCGQWDKGTCASLLPAKQDGGYYIYTGSWISSENSTFANGSQNCSGDNTPSRPILLSQTATANTILATHNAITLHVQSTAKLEIYNLNGKLQKSLNFTGGVYNIPLGNLPKGIYIANVKFSNPANPLIGEIGVQTKVVVK